MSLKLAEERKSKAWNKLAGLIDKVSNLEKALTIQESKKDLALRDFLLAQLAAHRFTCDDRESRKDEYEAAVAKKNAEWKKYNPTILAVSDLNMAFFSMRREKEAATVLFYDAYTAWSNIKYATPSAPP